MKNAIMTNADRREAGRERGSILLFALTVLLFFSGLAIFLKTVLDPQTILDAKDAERVAEADVLADSGFEAYGALVAAALANSSELAGADGEAGEKLVKTLNDIAEVTIEDKDGKKTGVFYTNHDFIQEVRAQDRRQDERLVRQKRRFRHLAHGARRRHDHHAAQGPEPLHQRQIRKSCKAPPASNAARFSR